MIGADVAQVVVLGSVPAAAAFGMLRLEQLYAVAFMSALLALVFDVASQSYLPTLVSEDQVVEANSKLAATASAGSLLGPTLGGALVQLLTAPIAIAVDAASFAVSAVSAIAISAREPARVAGPGDRGLGSFLASVVEGVRLIAGSPLLRALSGSAGLFNLFDGVIFAVYVLYATRQLAIPPAVLGAIFAASGAGGLIGALLAGRVARRLGLGRALLAALLVATAGELLIALAAGPVPVAAALLLAAELIVGFGAATFGVNHVSLRQLVTPASMQGRVHAANRMLGNGLGPLGALAGGILGQAAGLRAPLVVGALGTLVAALWLLASPVRSWRTTSDASQG
jgi:MFS family permease